MITLTEIESLTRVYAEKREHLANIITSLQAEMDAAKRQRIAAIKRAVSAAAEAYTVLHAEIEAAPALFEKPKTQTFSGIRIGYMKQRGQVVINDDEAVIRRMRKQLPKDQAELLIRVRESVHKPAVYDLTAADLKRLGITIDDDADVVVVKPVDRSIDKLVDAMLKDAEQIDEAAA